MLRTMNEYVVTSERESRFVMVSMPVSGVNDCGVRESFQLSILTVNGDEVVFSFDNVLLRVHEIHYCSVRN